MTMSSGARSLTADPNVTPLIDVLLVLLIIFMVLVPVKARGVNSSVPQDSAIAQTSQPAVVELISNATPGDVSYRVNQRVVARDAVGPTLRGIFAIQPERTVFLKADRKLSYEPVAWVAGEAKRAGASNLVLAPLK